MEFVESIIIDGKRYNVIATLSAGAAEGATNQVQLLDENGQLLSYLNPLSAFSVKGQKVMGAGALEILPANPNRIGGMICNLDATNVVYIGDSSAVLSTTGWPIAPGGLTATSIGSRWIINDYVGPIFGIAPAGTPNVAYFAW